ncbi:hypothetical protein JAAARDRAFT_40801 [Jaapia argillacea MUCL 33604]|uniref:Threonine/serine exporter-like N-terminal domain-containing protein n=1 Tax=Jaapia argillacea MUCL 33604 TaxID=933084 RepID=A0A067PL64_9AGAM|nr:hypothetical protein JAAARDRAFT_40801 [Jaapia argillacea MUCL 33604]
MSSASGSTPNSTDYVDKDKDRGAAPRPAGGTSRAPGNKTPRKVQWKDEQNDGRTLSSMSLDEQALNSEAFQSLTHALERHRSSSSTQPPPRLPHTSLHIPPPIIDSTSQSTPPTTATDTETDSPGSDVPMHPAPTRSVPGENIIEATETAGLPGRTDMETYSRRAAEDVVGAHRRGLWGNIRMKHRGKDKENVKKDLERIDGIDPEGEVDGGADGDVEEAGEKPTRRLSFWRSKRRGSKPKPERDLSRDVEHEAQRDSASPPTQLGTGVLSALLALYDHQTGLGSGASTPARSSLDFGSTPPSILSRSSSVDALVNLTTRSDLPPVDPPTSVVTTGPTPPPSTSVSGPPTGAGKAPSKAPLPFTKLLPESRPAQHRNAGGVIGSLIASTGNISGAAAPTNSTLAPNIKRPGYHLSRYSLGDEVPTRSRPRAPKSLLHPQSSRFEHDNGSVSSLPLPPPLPAAHSGSSHTSPATSRSQSSSGEHSVSRPHTPDPFNRVDHHDPDHPDIKRHSGKWSHVIKDLPKFSLHHGWTSSAPGTPATASDSGEWLDEKGLAATMWRSATGASAGTTMSARGVDEKEKEKEKERRREKERKRKRKKAEVYITHHVAEIIQRQEFILKFARAMMMFGGPTHRLQAQIQATARVLDIELSCMYLPDVMLISFDDAATSTSNIKFIRQGSALDLDKLAAAYRLYWKVIHDTISVKEASLELDLLMRRKPLYKPWQLILIGGLCSASICSVSFSGSFIDCLVVFPMGAMLVAIQLLSVRNELYSNVFEITVATLMSFLAAALASSRVFCYSAVASSAVVLILPGFIVLNGSLELASRNITSGAVRLCYACVYSLFLGFGLAIGAEIYQTMTGQRVLGPEDYSCAISHNPNGPWWQVTPSLWWAFLTVPMYSFFLSLRNQAPWNRRELPLLVAIACIGWVTNHFTGTKFVNQSDISAAVGAFAVGLVANVYGRFFKGNAFVVMITGILFQLPSGLGNGGLLTFASQQTSGSSSSTSYLSGFQTALQLISVGIGLTVGLGISIFIVHPIQSRRRASGVFSL